MARNIPIALFGSASYYRVYEIIDVEYWTAEEPKIIKKNVLCDDHCFLDNGDLFVTGGQYQTIHNLILLVDPPSICTHTFSFDSNAWKLIKERFLFI